MSNTTTDELKIEISADTGNAAQNINQTAKAIDDLGKSAGTADNDVTALVKAMSDAAANMVSTAQGISNSVSGLTSFETMANATQSTLTGLNFRFDTLNTSIQQSYGAFDSAAASVRELSDASATSTAALNGVVSATDGFAERMGELQTNTQGTSDSMSELQRGLVEALSSMRSFSDNIGSAGRDAADACAKIKELSLKVGSIPTSQPVALAAGFKTLKSAIATLGIVKFVKDTNSAYVTQMQNESKLTSHMKHRMNATDDEIKAIKELASAQQKIGVIGDEIQLAGAQQLTTYARESNTLKTLIPAMNNLIAQTAGYEATTGDATSAADMLGRALNGQYTSLKRMGVTFTEAQEQVLQYGNESQKAAVLADAINAKVGNMNELLAQTPTGQMKQLQNELGDLQEQIGATWQPLVASVIPIIRGSMEMLAEPIKNVSRGISVIGQAIASIDSPVTRGIALAVAGAVALSKLKLLIGGTASGLLLLGTIVAAITGSMVEQQDDIGKQVEEAYNNVSLGVNDATGAMSDFNDETVKTEKTLNRLAGFDTITKLSGGSNSGTLINSLLGDNWQANLDDATNSMFDIQSAANDVEDAINAIPDNKRIAFAANTVEAQQRIERFATDATTVLNNLGNVDVMYRPLERMTKDIEDLLNANGLDGTGFVNFWKGVGDDIYDALAGDDSAIYKGLKDIDGKMEEYGLKWKFYGVDIASVFGRSLYMMTHAEDIVQSGQADLYIENLINDFRKGYNGQIIGDAFEWAYSITGFKDKLQSFVSADDFSLREYQMLIAEKLREGLTSEDAFNYAKSAYLSTADAQKWAEQFVAPSDRSWLSDVNTVEAMRLRMIESGEISSSQSYKDVPIQPTSIPSYVTDNGYVTNVQVYINDEERDASYVKITGGK